MPHPPGPAMSKHAAAALLLPLLFGCDESSNRGEFDDRCGYYAAVGLVGLDKVVVSGSPAISGDGASLFSNGTIELAGNFTLEGDAIAGGEVTISGSNLPSGDIFEGAAAMQVEDPTEEVEAAALANDNATIPCVQQGNQCNSPVSAQGVLSLQSNQSLTLQTGNYYFKGISLNGQAELHIDGQVVIYLDGPATFNGGSSTNPDADLLTVISAAADDVKLNGNADARMAILAPFAAVRFSGT